MHDQIQKLSTLMVCSACSGEEASPKRPHRKGFTEETSLKSSLQCSRRTVLYLKIAFPKNGFQVWQNEEAFLATIVCVSTQLGINPGEQL